MSGECGDMAAFLRRWNGMRRSGIATGLTDSSMCNLALMKKTKNTTVRFPHHVVDALAVQERMKRETMMLLFGE